MAPESNGHAHASEEEHAHAEGDAAANGHDEAHEGPSEAVTVAATVGVVAVGAVLWEVALLPGIALGVVAMLAPKYVPRLGSDHRLGAIGDRQGTALPNNASISLRKSESWGTATRPDR